MNERTRTLRQASLDTPPGISAERAELLTRFYRENEGQHSVPVMRAQGHGRIIFNSSILGFSAMRFRGAYNASKFALEGLVDTLRLELRGTAIHVSLIEPGPIATRFIEHALDAYRRNVDIENTPYREIYRARMAQMENGGQRTHKLPPEAVAKKLVHALEAARPKARYYVTFPTYAAAFLRLVLPARALDAVAARN